MPVFEIRRSWRNLQKLAGCDIGRPMYSSRWKSVTSFQSMPGVAVKASRNSNWDAALAATTRASPRLAMAERIAVAACAAAVLPSESLSLKTLSSILKPPVPTCVPNRLNKHEPSRNLARGRGIRCKREAENIAPGGDRHVLDSRDGIRHRRGAHELAGVEMPEDAASGGFHRFERVGVVAEEDQAASRRQSASPGIARANLRVAPDAFSICQG